MAKNRLPDKWKLPSLNDSYEMAFQRVGDLTFNAKDRMCRIRGGPSGRKGYSERVPCKAVIVDGNSAGLIISDHMGALYTFKGGTLCLLGRKKNVVECGRKRK